MSKLSLAAAYEKYGSNLRSHSVEVPIPTNSGKYFFFDDTILREQTVVGFTVFSPSTMFFNIDPLYAPNSPISQNPIVGGDVLFTSFVTFMCGNLALYQDLPLQSAVPTQGEPIGFFPLVLEDLDPSKSFIRCSDPA